MNKKEITKYLDHLIRYDKDLSKKTKKTLREVRKKVAESTSREEWVEALTLLLGLIEAGKTISHLISP